MDDTTLDEPLGTRAAHWLRPTPAELLGLTILLLGAMTASGIWWFQAVQRPTPLANDAVVAGIGAEGDDGGGLTPGDAEVGSDAGSGLGESGHGTPVGQAVPVTVHVTGAVEQPGLVRVAAGSRVGDAVVAAGGLRDDAASAGVNLARPLTDGEQVHVPAEGETPVGPVGGAGDVNGIGTVSGGASPTSSPGITSDGRVDLNRASAQELETLPGVGPARAEAIVAYREEHGPFAVPGDLRGVRGIGEATFQALAELVTVG